MTVHKLIFKEFPLFTQIGEKQKGFINWISAQFKAQILIQGSIVYNEDDEITTFYFQTKGLAAFVLPKMSGMVYAIIDPEKQLFKNSIKKKMRVFQYYGMEDSIYNHLRLLVEKKANHSTKIIK